MAFIRRALPKDAAGIHEAHMRSIQETCSKDYSEKEIKAWGHRDFQRDHRLQAIQKHFVWVVEDLGKIEGYGELEIIEKSGFREAHVWGLYLTPEVQGRGFGRELLELILAEAKNSQAGIVKLASTLTAQDFYRKIGFRESGPPGAIRVNSVPIRCIPMILKP